MRQVPREDKTKRLAVTAIEMRLFERLKQLPPGRVAEVVDFVEFLAAREDRAAAAERLARGLARLDALNVPPVSEAAIADEVQAARALRHARKIP